MKKTIYFTWFIAWCCITATTVVMTAQSPKREFRGTWVHTVGNQQYKNMTTDQMQAHYLSLLDSFERAGINVVIFQIRPQADAFFISDIEPWSRFITGEQGRAPQPLWDPLQFMIEQCHARGMELHAWLNPYRVTSSDTETLCADHLYYKKPYLFLKYGRQIYFDPGHPESREHTLKVIADVVKRYDLDAIHFDDYFYPYKIKYEEFPDEESFMKYHAIDGFGRFDKNNWRRNNVNLLIKELNHTIKEIKPWVKFGISPFGVWRNIADDPTGSNSRNMSNYDDLYADIKLWVEKGWIDYNVPQLYWEIGNPISDYAVMEEWWSNNNFGQQLYIGQNIGSVLITNRNQGSFESQLHTKIEMGRNNPNVHGDVWWSGYSLTRNPNGLIDSLSDNYYKYPSLLPRYSYIDTVPPKPVGNLNVKRSGGETRLVWQEPPATTEMDRAVRYCIYRFDPKEPVDLENAEKIVKVVGKNEYTLPAQKENKEYLYVVTALDRMWNESAPTKGIRIRH